MPVISQFIGLIFAYEFVQNCPLQNTQGKVQNVKMFSEWQLMIPILVREN